MNARVKWVDRILFTNGCRCMLPMSGGTYGMATIRLSWRARKTLERVVRSSSSAHMVRRAQALLWLHQNERIDEVAQRLGLTRRAVYKIVERYQARSAEPVEARLRDQPHTGRPASKRQKVAQVLDQLLQQPPSRYGYRALVWTTPMLHAQAQRQLTEPISARTVRRALRELRYRYKRPRYVLARRSPTWRQAKGGSKLG